MEFINYVNPFGSWKLHSVSGMYAVVKLGEVDDYTTEPLFITIPEQAWVRIEKAQKVLSTINELKNKIAALKEGNKHLRKVSQERWEKLQNKETMEYLIPLVNSMKIYGDEKQGFTAEVYRLDNTFFTIDRASWKVLLSSLKALI